MTIFQIRSPLARRLALIGYLPVFVVGFLLLTCLQWAHDVMLATIDGIHATAAEVGTWPALIRDTWRGPLPSSPAGCSCPKGFTCYERCGDG